MKSILLIGLGRFGRHMAEKLHELRHQVLAVDLDENRVNEVLPFVTNAQIGDSTNEAFVSSLGVRNFDLCIVAIGDNFQSSLETAALLKDLGAKYVLARANREVHAKFLLRNGADSVVYPEQEMAVRTAVKYSSDNIFDYIELTPNHSIYEIPVPAGWVGRTIVQLAVRTKYHISILATKCRNQLELLPKPDHLFQPDETLIIMGENKDIQRFLQ
ncbi:TrkA family potassium uptake protein [Anaerotruncus sp. AF02-27]|uniref:potassium channel family protein n=1 Tax=Anaerotruncus sp. AF02-27 TaxID=2292191 RepID=UPI000E4B80FE|nr:TrkA family potassium uptake protein [Anaerotruncus sp. AF02-27]RGX55457.1 TrkA family potassium uptake protein [Anaerotruncus sp. AF02-27]